MWDNDEHLWREQDEDDARERAFQEVTAARRDDEAIEARWTDEEIAVAQTRWARIAETEGAF